MNSSFAILFAIVVAGEWLFGPGFNGFMYEPDAISLGDSRIFSSIFLVGGAILQFIRPAPND
jgi:hypothetical protein